MKKTNILASLILGLVFVLTACTGASPSRTESPDLTGVPELPGGLETQGAPAEPAPFETPATTEEAGAPSATEEMTATESLPSTGMIDAGLVSNLLEFGVFSQDGERIGDAEDLVLDIENMELAYLVVNVDGKLTPVPWELVTIVAGKAETTGAAETPQNDFVLTLDRAVLSEAPSFAAGEFPDTQKMDWDADILAYWQEHLPAESAYPAP